MIYPGRNTIHNRYFKNTFSLEGHNNIMVEHIFQLFNQLHHAKQTKGL